MKARYLLPLLVCALLILPVGLISAVGLAREAHNQPQAPVGTAFTYQGLLTDEGNPVEGPCDFQFGLWDDPITGTLVAGPVEQTGVALEAGRFTVLLDLGDVFDGTALWLEIAVQCPGDPGYGALDPRQALTAAPYARAVSWDGVYDMPAGFADGVDDDTLYDAGTGLALAGTIFSITPTYRLPQACVGGQLAKWDGAQWTCAADDIDDADADPANELEMPTGCANGQLAKWDGSGWGCDGDADTTYQAGYGLVLTDTTFHVLTDTVQQRVSGSCAVGSTVRAINADGSVVCQLDAPLNRSNAPVANALTTLDSAGVVGCDNSITIGMDGLGLISYYDDTNGDLKVAHCDNLACTSATITTLESTGNVGSGSSVVIGADGLGLISYYDATNSNLRVAHCENVACTSVVFTTLDTGLGNETSVMIGADGLGLIVYRDNTALDLKVAHCGNVACTTATLATLDSVGDVGLMNEIALGADGLGLIAYWDWSNLDLKVAHCDNVACTSAVLTTLDGVGNVGGNCSVSIGSDGLGLIVYQGAVYTTDDDVKIAHCNDLACTSATITTLVSEGHVVALSNDSLTIGADDLGVIAYNNFTQGTLVVAHCRDVNCASATLITLDNTGPYAHAAVSIGADGLPLIAYGDRITDDLNAAHCSNPFCVPYWRRR